MVRQWVPCFAIVLVWAVVQAPEAEAAGSGLLGFARCHLCETRAPEGPIEDCCQECDAATVDEATNDFFLPLLNDLATTHALRYFRVDLWRDCGLWQDDGTCMRESCAVCECPPDQLPPALQGEAQPAGAEGAPDCSQGKTVASASEGSGVAAGVSPAQVDALSRVALGGGPDQDSDLKGWELPRGEQERAQWTEADPESSSLAYVDLLKNPEGFTGYSGPDAHRIWSSVYDENCFRGTDGEDEGLCLEERAFFRLVSGLHASISTHLSLNALDGRPHTQLWVDRVGRWPNRIRNLYFTFLVVLRAVRKAGDRLLAPGLLSSGLEGEDSQVRAMLTRLVGSGEHPAADLVGQAFDEQAMFRVRREEVVEACPAVLSGGLTDMQELTRRYHEAAQRKAALRAEFQGKFRNISRIMDCVGCEKCRMWGKLQFLGLGTAMKVLFDDDGAGAEIPLTRNEAVALVNVLHRLAISVAEVTNMRDREAAAAAMNVASVAGGVLLAGLVVASGWCVGCKCRKGDKASREAASNPDGQPAKDAEDAGDAAPPANPGLRKRASVAPST
ncbi:hypothetical protein FNF27_03223 [Cafeteria roenbergensis]|uniref:Endoplasmic reticulum oxidoreductin 1 n=1 Tax=Cafeteria roenbergensis TaxID=33653 RepID=A0A5A8EBK6_CAFRO|nr:hypothetical protein FNF27_03223 [Cafeteria roenbergensis]